MNIIFIEVQQSKYYVLLSHILQSPPKQSHVEFRDVIKRNREIIAVFSVVGYCCKRILKRMKKETNIKLSICNLKLFSLRILIFNMRMVGMIFQFNVKKTANCFFSSF